MINSKFIAKNIPIWRKHNIGKSLLLKFEVERFLAA